MQRGEFHRAEGVTGLREAQALGGSHRLGCSHGILGSEDWGITWFRAPSPIVCFSSGGSRPGSQSELTWASHLLAGRLPSGQALFPNMVHIILQEP